MFPYLAFNEPFKQIGLPNLHTVKQKSIRTLYDVQLNWYLVYKKNIYESFKKCFFIVHTSRFGINYDIIYF